MEVGMIERVEELLSDGRPLTIQFSGSRKESTTKQHLTKRLLNCTQTYFTFIRLYINQIHGYVMYLLLHLSMHKV
jgi:hypothetical protein